MTFDEVVALVASKPKPMLVGIDGLPLSGKTTLALRLIEEFGAECMGLDDFVRPETEWPSRDTPSFPFDYIRYSEFVAAVRSLAHDRRCFFHPYEWDTGNIAREPTVSRGDGIALVEGVSVLHPDLAPLYDLRVWVESDPETTLAASLERGVGSWVHEWQFMFLPSVELYLRTDPKSGADVVALGRGLRPTEPVRVRFPTCAVTRRRFPVGARPTRRFAPAGSNRSRHGRDEMSEAFG